MIKGIDISAYQQNIDFEKAKKSGIEFVIIRAGFGKVATQKDKSIIPTQKLSRRQNRKQKSSLNGLRESSLNIRFTLILKTLPYRTSANRHSPILF